MENNFRNFFIFRKNKLFKTNFREKKLYIISKLQNNYLCVDLWLVKIKFKNMNQRYSNDSYTLPFLKASFPSQFYIKYTEYDKIQMPIIKIKNKKIGGFLILSFAFEMSFLMILPLHYMMPSRVTIGVQ